MSSSKSSGKQYFLGINGEQSGPFSVATLRGKMQKGEVPYDTLVWCEGMADWRPVAEVPELNSASPEADLPQLDEKTTSQLLDHHPDGGGAIDPDEVGAATYSEGTVPGEPIFGRSDAIVSDSVFVRHRKASLVTGVTLLTAFFGVLIYFWANTTDPNELSSEAPKPKISIAERRITDVRNLLSELYVKPTEKISALNTLIRANPKDEASQLAVQTLVDYYRQVQRPSDSGLLLMTVDRPAEAAKYFMMEPVNLIEAERAYFKAFELEKGAGRKDHLVASIKLLLGPLSNMPVARERLALLDKEFPGEPHPYGYYLKDAEGRITDLFSRLSFHYVKSLLDYFSTEMPQVTLLSRPLVEVKKIAPDAYRIVASYRGAIALNKDRMSNIRFDFWLMGERWTMIETNLTPEREKFARKERGVAMKSRLSADQLLNEMETVFHTLFPKSGLHESVADLQRATASQAPKEE